MVSARAGVILNDVLDYTKAFSGSRVSGGDPILVAASYPLAPWFPRERVFEGSAVFYGGYTVGCVSSERSSRDCGVIPIAHISMGPATLIFSLFLLWYVSARRKKNQGTAPRHPPDPANNSSVLCFSGRGSLLFRDPRDHRGAEACDSEPCEYLVCLHCCPSLRLISLN